MIEIAGKKPERRNWVKVPVSLLREGLYVAEPDRPWTDLPFMLQEFEIHTEEELEVFREHCNFVYIDMGQSNPTAVSAIQAAAREQQPAHGHRSMVTESGSERTRPRDQHTEAFGARLRTADAHLSRTKSIVSGALEDLRLGRSIKQRSVQAAVTEIVDQISQDPDATVFLTSLTRRNVGLAVHSINTCVLSIAFAMRMGVDGKSIGEIGLGALLHDVGKLELPSELLERSGPLTAEEWDQVRRHPTIGREILASKAVASEAVLEITQSHHERIAGDGYPAGIAGADIPTHVRIVAIANAYESMTSERPYRDARPPDEALQQLYDERDSNYGANIVQEFIQSVGIFPIGSLVKLDNGAIAVVVESNPQAHLKPKVLLLRTPDGEYYEKRLLLDLATNADADGGTPARRIRHAVNPSRYDIDPARIVAFEFGVVL